VEHFPKRYLCVAEQAEANKPNYKKVQSPQSALHRRRTKLFEHCEIEWAKGEDRADEEERELWQRKKRE
jgi:hypothetical protein